MQLKSIFVTLFWITRWNSFILYMMYILGTKCVYRCILSYLESLNLNCIYWTYDILVKLMIYRYLFTGHNHWEGVKNDKLYIRTYWLLIYKYLFSINKQNNVSTQQQYFRWYVYLMNGFVWIWCTVDPINRIVNIYGYTRKQFIIFVYFLYKMLTFVLEVRLDTRLSSSRNWWSLIISPTCRIHMRHKRVNVKHVWHF